MLACLGMLVPKCCLAAPPVTANNAGILIADVALQEGGSLRGQVLDSQGVPRAEIPVAVFHQDNVVARTNTNGQGEFSVTGLRGGVHTVTTGQAAAACRFWAPNTAPPNAKAQLLVIDQQPVVRGQPSARHAIAHVLSNPLLLLGVAALAIGIPAIINASGDDNDSGS